MFPSAAASLSLSLQRRTAPVVSHNAPVRGGRRTYRSQYSASAIASPTAIASAARLPIRSSLSM